jgi:hypothetical protein
MKRLFLQTYTCSSHMLQSFCLLLVLECGRSCDLDLHDHEIENFSELLHKGETFIKLSFQIHSEIYEISEIKCILLYQTGFSAVKITPSVLENFEIRCFKPFDKTLAIIKQNAWKQVNLYKLQKSSTFKITCPVLVLNW